jgi:hypothetical protein
MRLVFLCLALAACGGKLDTGDAGGGGVDAGPDGVVKDAQPGPDVISPPAQCTPISGNTTVSSDGSCTTTAQWSCGATKYGVQCSCPSTQCTCSEETSQGGVGHIVKEPSFCPSCSGDVAAICGFPH